MWDTAILVRRVIVHHSVPIPGLTRLEATSTFAGRPVKILPAYFSPSRPLIRADLTAILVGWGWYRYFGRRSQRQTCVLELASEHEMGKSYLTMPMRTSVRSLKQTSNHQPIQLLRYSRCLEHRNSEGLLVSGVSDFVLDTKLGPPPDTHWHCVSLILLTPTGSPWFQGHLLGQHPNSLGISNSVWPVIAQPVDNRHARWEFLWRRFECSGSVYSQVSPAWRPTASDTDCLQEEIHEKNRLRWQWHVSWEPDLKSEVNRLQRSVTRWLNEWRNEQWIVTLESLDPEDQSLWITKRAMRVPTPSAPLDTPGGNRSLTLWESRSLCRQSVDSVSAGDPSFGPGSYWDGWRGAIVLFHDPCHPYPS